MRKSNRYLIALVAALGLIPVVLDTTIVVVALARIQNELHTDVNTGQWIVTGFFLANAAVVAIGGYLGGRFGRKRIFILGITVFTIGSFLCGISPSIGWLIAFRAVQGIGGGLMLPIGPALAFDAFAKEERAKASAVVAVPVLLAPVFGPIAGGYLIDTFDWHSIFYVNLPIGALAVLAALLVLPRDKPGAARGARFDYLGLLLSTLGVVAIVYAFKLVTQTDPSTVTATNPGGHLYGWGYWLVWTLLGAGAVVLGIFALYALRISRDPALDLRQLGRRDFLVSNTISWATALITFGLLVLLPLYFEFVRLPHLSALDTGLALVPLGIGSLVGTVASAALYRAVGPRWVVLLGASLSALGAWLFAHTIQPTADAGQILAAVQTHTKIPAVVGPDELRWELFIVGLSFTLIAVAAQTLALEALTGEALAKASSLFISTKFIFSSIGVAILTTILVNRTSSRASDLIGQLHALGQGTGISPSDPRVVAALRAVEAQIGTQAGTWAIQSIFWLIFFGSFVLIALAFVLPGRRRKMDAAVSAAEKGVDYGSGASGEPQTISATS
ncbi:MAG TPA: DHA2 family efflux MFS transporter permease subunit [Ktedonobacterales bacterium]|nr:DHA2 family efflux MFS transporter permease subunit [Ktedonobacterales bacterium]